MVVRNALLSPINSKIIAVTEIHLSYVLSLGSRIDSAALCQEMKCFRIDFRILINLSAIWILLNLFSTQLFLK